MLLLLALSACGRRRTIIHSYLRSHKRTFGNNQLSAVIVFVIPQTHNHHPIPWVPSTKQYPKETKSIKNELVSHRSSLNGWVS